MQLRFRKCRPVAFIDFDAAHPGQRRHDVGYAAWLWLDLGNEDLDPVQQGRRIGEFAATYAKVVITDAIPAIVDAQTELSRRREAPSERSGARYRTTQSRARHEAEIHDVSDRAGLSCVRTTGCRDERPTQRGDCRNCGGPGFDECCVANS